MVKHRRHIFGAVLIAAAAVMLAAVPAQARTTYKVKTEKNYYLADGKWVLNYQNSYEYNKKGLQTKQTYKCGDIKRVLNYQYNAKGYATKETFKETLNGKTESTYRYEYDLRKNGDTNVVRYYSDGKLAHKTVYHYNRKNRVTSTEYYEGGKKTSTSKYTYNKKGRITKIVSKNARGKTTQTAKYTYTFRNGRLSQETIKYTGADGNYTYTTKYYTNGAIKSTTAKSEHGSSVYTYDKKGRLTKNTESADNYSSVSTYKNGLIQKTVDQSNGSTMTTKYTYKTGKKGVTRQTAYVDGKKNSKTEYTYVKIK